MSGTCDTRFPILLIHGTGVRDWRRVGYWGRIPDALRDRGARVFHGGQDSWATVEANAAALKERVQAVLAETGSGKVHLIAHSKGGLEARYLVSSLGMAPYVASVTTISTPHHGSKTMDVLYRLPHGLFRLGGFFVDLWYRLLGDRDPDFFAVCGQFTTAWAEAFNRANPDAEGVLYRTYGGVMAGPASDLLMAWQHFVVRRVEGDNDGLVSLASAQWTGFRGPWRGVGRRGISHLDEVDLRRRPLWGRPQADGISDVVVEYVAMVAELKELGL